MCNTEQNYSGEQVFQNTSEPTAQPPRQAAPTAAQPLTPTDERRAYFHRLAELPYATEYLELILDSLQDFNDSTDPVPLLAELTESYLTHPYHTLTQERAFQVRDALSLIKFLAELRSRYTCFAIEAQAAHQQPQKEVSNG